MQTMPKLQWFDNELICRYLTHLIIGCKDNRTRVLHHKIVCLQGLILRSLLKRKYYTFK